MVRSDDFARLRKLNFGFQSLTETHTPENLLRQIEQYDPDDAQKVRELLRSTAGLDHAVTDMVAIYDQLISEYRTRRPIRGGMRDIASMADLARAPLAYRALNLWTSFPPEKRQALRNNPGFRMIEGTVRRTFYGRPR